jgi:hypothetical protein
VQQHHDVEIVGDRQVVAGLLVPAVAEVALVPDHGDRQVRSRLLVAQRHQVGGVVARVVTDEDLGDATAEVLRDAVEDAGKRGDGVVGHDEHPDAGLAAPDFGRRLDRTGHLATIGQPSRCERAGRLRAR